MAACCSRPRARRRRRSEFEIALASLHSFYFPETVRAFTAIPQTDPTCAIAYWGLAVSIRPNPLVGPWDAATLKRGLDAVEKGEAIGAKTERERDWLAAIKEFYKDFDKVDQDTRTRNYEKAMEALAKKYPDDVEAKMFHALALNETFNHKTWRRCSRPSSILEPLDKKYPDHPGITHYLIHSYDFAPIAKKGIPAANKYAKIAPVGAARAAHAFAHLLDGRHVEGVDRVEPQVDPGVEETTARRRSSTAFSPACRMRSISCSTPTCSLARTRRRKP